MTTKDKIIAAHTLKNLYRKYARCLYMTDYTHRSNFTRGVEVCTSNPEIPGGGALMDCIEFHNDHGLLLDFAIFEDRDYVGQLVKSNEHCEGVCYLTKADPLNWMAFIEIKDCAPSSIITWKRKAQRQIFNVYKDFLNRGIIQPNVKIHGIISCPQKHCGFNDTLFDNMYEQKKLHKWTHINYYATNWVYIIDKNTLEVKTS